MRLCKFWRRAAFGAPIFTFTSFMRLIHIKGQRVEECMGSTCTGLSAPPPPPPTSPTIENWWGRDDRWRHNARHMTSFMTKKKPPKRCCWNCNIGPNWFTITFIAYITTAHVKFHCQKVESKRNGKLRQLSGRFPTLIWRPRETVQNLESPALSGRVGSLDVALPPFI